MATDRAIITSDDESELVSTFLNMVEAADSFSSSKLKNVRTLTYSVTLSAKDPEDIRFGNDAGCCIGVYEIRREQGIGNAWSVPIYPADNGTIF